MSKTHATGSIVEMLQKKNLRSIAKAILAEDHSVFEELAKH
jgi:hypothetical protein